MALNRIECAHVTYSYEAHGRRETVLRDLSFTAADGEFLCIVGQSGCGKTTLLRLLAGLAFPDGGAVRVGGAPVAGPGTDRAIVFQNYTLFPWMSARKNVMFGIAQARKELSRAETAALADEYLEKVDMLRAADKYPYQLSGGMRQRVALARSLAMDTGILLLDEPFGALDARIRGGLQRLLETLCTGEKQKKTVIFVTHDIHEAVFLADRVLYMADGRIVRELPVDLPRPRADLCCADADRLCAARRELLGWFDRTETEVQV